MMMHGMKQVVSPCTLGPLAAQALETDVCIPAPLTRGRTKIIRRSAALVTHFGSRIMKLIVNRNELE